MEVNENLYYLIRFVAEFHRPPKSREVYEGKKVGQYFHNIRRGASHISSEDAEYLSRLGLKLHTENRQEKVHKTFLGLKKYIRKNGKKPGCKDTYKGVNLYFFFQNVLSGNTSLNDKDQKEFDVILQELSCNRNRGTQK